MKQIMIWMILAVGLSVGACHQTTVGYLGEFGVTRIRGDSADFIQRGVGDFESGRGGCGDFQERLDNPWRRSFAVPVRE